ncbi:MAG: zf-HC2 domain-containing protein [Verrucomicrobia bacterium]|nr:zf-HC2 domain-containing protein [Verrucomicrobiota bacterium]
MKDSEFIELLNLYLDHEISAADAARLEAEVQRNPARREIYRQYCQMQKACSLLASDFTAAPAEGRKVVSFEQPRHAAWQPLRWSAAGLAAAACIAFVVLNRNTNPTPSAQAPVAQFAAPVVEPQTPPPATDTRTIARTVTTPSRPAELQPALNTTSFSLTSSQGAVALRPEQFEWLRNVQVAPMPQAPSVDELLRFETRPATLKTGPATYRSGRPMQGQAEFVGFEFKK